MHKLLICRALEMFRYSTYIERGYCFWNRFLFLGANIRIKIKSTKKFGRFYFYYFVRARMKVETEVSMPKRESHMEVELAKKEFRAWTFLGST